MKKFMRTACLLLTLFMVLGMFAGCASKDWSLAHGAISVFEWMTAIL